MDRRKRASVWMVFALIASACSSTPESPQPAAANVTSVRKEGPGSLAQANTIQTTATVVSIDQATRVATLRTQDGRQVTVKASDQVRNLSQVQPGDQVHVTYFESVVIQVRRPGEATPGVAAAAASTRAALGERPAASEVESITLVATVAEIDRSAQTVTLENSDGTRRTVNVRNPAQFDHVALGDLVEITFTDAVAISVEEPVSR